MRLLPSVCAAVLGCAEAASRVDVELHSSQMPLKIVSATRQADGRVVIWGWGDNSEAFAPAIYSPYPGSARAWCLYLDRSASRAVLIEEDVAASRFVVFDMPEVSIKCSVDMICGRALAQISEYSTKDARPVQAESRPGATSTRVEFRLAEPSVARMRPDQVRRFLPLIARLRSSQAGK